jgi:PAS domain S-box-containing protein
MPREIRSAPLRYGLALASFALILLLSFALQRFLPFRVDLTFLIIIAMIASAWYLGRGPGLLFAVVFEATLDYFAAAPLSMRSSIIIVNRLILFVSLVWFASSRRKVEKRLREQREWLEVTLASIGDAVIATDVKGSVIFINPIAESLTGRSMPEAANKPLNEIFMIINEETREPVESPFSTVMREGIVVGLANHSILVTNDDREIPIEDSGAPIRDPDGKIFGVIVVFHDVSERRQAERERESLLEREQVARSEAETANRLKDEFLATVSHELRTPLSAILGWSSMLNSGQVSEEIARNALSIIERNAKAQAGIISDILDVSRIITGKLHIDPQLVELGPIINAVVDTQRLAASAKGISLTVAIDPSVGLVAGDPDRLQQVIWNLVSNAIKFTPREGRIEVRLDLVDGQVQVTVSDTGKGIDKEFIPYVFERFRQADSSTTRAHGGLGLGLAIVRHLVELHGGSVAAESAGEDRGAVFKVRLPAADVAGLAGVNLKSELTVPEEPSQVQAALPDLTGWRVLVVDDEPDTLEVVRIMLAQFGAEVRVAASSNGALEAFVEWQPDVLVSDVGMPDQDGYDLITKVRALSPEQGGDTPAAALTAHVGDEDRVRALAAGYQAHIKKPVDPRTLGAAVLGLGKREKKTTSKVL